MSHGENSPSIKVNKLICWNSALVAIVGAPSCQILRHWTFEEAVLGYATRSWEL
jgi:hypothetical protein